MNRFFKLKGKRTLMPFLMLGDPDFNQSLVIIESALEAGVDALELGIPFSDPLADGPIIQASAERALAAGMQFERCLELLSIIRSKTNIPIAILTYTNLVFHRGFDHAFHDLHAAGVDALLLADLSFDESQKIKPLYEKNQLGQIFLIAQNTDLERAQMIHQHSTGFTYLINSMGTTGMREGIPPETLTRLDILKTTGEAPIFVGFGIHTADQVNTLWNNGADGVIIGSKLIYMLGRHQPIKPYLQGLKS